MNLKKKVTLLFLLIGLLPFILGSAFSLWYSAEEMETIIMNQLNSVDSMKKEQIETYFEERLADVEALADSVNIEEGMPAFSQAFEEGLNSEIYQEHREHYESYLEKYIESQDYYDLFLINLQGDIVYTVKKEADLGINLNSEDYKSLSLAEAFRKGQNETTLTDYAYYEISKEQASFIATPIYDELKNKLGVLVLQLSDQSISDIMLNVEGLGETGEVYLVGEDLYMRSNSRFSEEGTIGVQKVDTLSVKHALNGEYGTHIIKDYRGEEVLSSYDSLEIKGLNWAIIAEIDANEAFASINNLRWIIVIMLVVLSPIIGFLAYLFSKSLTNPITQIQSQANRIANFDMTQRIEERLLERKDEIGDLGRALEGILGSFKEMIMTISEASKCITSSSQELTAMLEEASAAGEEVARAVGEIAEGAVQQASDTEKGQIKAVELGQFIEQDGGYTKELNKSTQNVDTAVKEGLEIMNYLIQTSDKSDEQVKQIQEDILQTDKSAKKIEEVSRVIATIAEQTNLLALNASIEAARAGEVGRGFTVVAEEIRKLAEQSSQSIEMINEIVAEVQNNSTRTVERMKLVAETLEEEREGIQRSRSKYEVIAEEMQESDKIVKRLNDSAEKMEYTKNNILEILQHLAAVAEENSVAVQEVSGSTEQQAVGVTEMTNTSLELSQLALEMHDVIMKFKMD